ncbi:hypothetical protein ACLOJK_024462 [Asimina triloba]
MDLSYQQKVGFGQGSIHGAPFVAEPDATTKEAAETDAEAATDQEGEDDFEQDITSVAKDSAKEGASEAKEMSNKGSSKSSQIFQHFSVSVAQYTEERLSDGELSLVQSKARAIVERRVPSGDDPTIKVGLVAASIPFMEELSPMDDVTFNGSLVGQGAILGVGFAPNIGLVQVVVTKHLFR